MNLISDLALILIVAGVTTLIFKRMRQPLILGYILAGFLTGPNMPYTPTVVQVENIHTWSEIGVIFIMFTLGLEFSFKKIVKMGIGPIVAALCIITFMITLGSFVGRLFGWSSMNSLFLGGMVAMSSTTVIYKALDELGLRQQKFAGVVLSVLILEDILGILLMVILSAMAAVGSLEGEQLVGSLAQLAFFLILWFVVGIYIVPQVLRRNSKWISRETLLVVSVGLCFLMVTFAEEAGYSSALGAFMMGSILAETNEAETIEGLVSPVKDLFGAIFFVSVGMLVNPSVLVQYWLPIVSIIAVILVGQTIFGSFSFILSGQPLKVAMQCGFSLTQIGEFSFILATLGVNLGVTSDFLYPVVVAVSIITTFTTPYMIKAATPAYGFVEKRLPRLLAKRLADTGTATGNAQPEKSSGLWRKMMTDLLVSTIAYYVLAWAVVGICYSTLLPFCRGVFGHWPGNSICGIVTVAAVSIMLRPIVMKKLRSDEVKQWRRERAWGSLILFWLTVIVRFAISTVIIYYVVDYLSPLRWYWHALGSALLILVICLEGIGKFQNPIAKRIKFTSIKMERIFRQNFQQREIRARRKRPGYENTLLRHDVHLSQLSLPENSEWAGRTLQELRFGKQDGVLIAAVIRGSGRINIPDGKTMLFPGDKLEVLGDDESLDMLSKRMSTEVADITPNDMSHRLRLERFRVGKGSPFAGRNLYKSGIRDVFQCMVVGFENKDEGDDTLELATADRVIQPGDVIWVVGEEGGLNLLLIANRGEA